jgi:hypothetical protein
MEKVAEKFIFFYQARAAGWGAARLLIVLDCPFSRL